MHDTVSEERYWSEKDEGSRAPSRFVPWARAQWEAPPVPSTFEEILPIGAGATQDLFEEMVGHGHEDQVLLCVLKVADKVQARWESMYFTKVDEYAVFPQISIWVRDRSATLPSADDRYQLAADFSGLIYNMVDPSKTVLAAARSLINWIGTITAYEDEDPEEFALRASMVIGWAYRFVQSVTGQTEEVFYTDLWKSC